MVKCDECGKEFDSERGLHIHQSQVHNEEDEESTESETNDSEEQNNDQVVEQINQETEGGLLGSFSREAVLAGGLMLGIALGLIVGYGAVSADPGHVQEASPAEVKSSVEELVTAGGEEVPELEIQDPERQHGMYYLEMSYEQEAVNQTTGEPLGEMENVEEAFYVTLDGELLFPVIQDLQLQTPINIEEQKQMMEQQQQEMEQGLDEDDLGDLEDLEEMEDMEDMEDDIEIEPE